MELKKILHKIKGSFVFHKKGAIILLLAPLVLYIFWYMIEYRKIDILNELEIPSDYVTSEEDCALISRLICEEGTYRINLNDEIKKEEKEFPNLTSAVSSIFLNKIGILARVFKHEACLKNNNVIYIEDEEVKNFKINDTDIPNDVGAIGIRQQDQESEWYALIGNNDCKDINKDIFLNASTTREYRYVLKSDIGPEAKNRRRAGEEYEFYINSFKIDTSESSFYIKLKFWSNIGWFYLVVLIIWSPIFFQIKKIIDYILKKKKT